VRCATDVAYGPEPVQRLDVFAPAADGPGPVLIDFHAGAWRAGSRRGREHLADTLTERGVLWVPVDYGLAPAFGIDAIVDHCRRAVAWIYERVADFGGDPSRIYVSGNSAGGHLAAVMLVEGWPETYGLPEDVVKGACAISGVYDLRKLVGAPPGGPNDELGMDDEVAARYSPIAHLPSRPRPLIVAVGEPEGGVFRPQAQAFVGAWRAAGLPVTFLEVPGQHHFSMGRRLGDPASELHVAAMAMMGVT
jgi:arylformamidase